ncbi:hypothetical protein [Geothrix sp. SG200]|uniref:hypothetical protein n=1 Tax=Geothrix sp. SG200 TaxID=2922865 RepID=UPI001FAE48F9|nr:hypothetical protein [Geothrix sp. SG200]
MSKPETFLDRLKAEPASVIVPGDGATTFIEHMRRGARPEVVPPPPPPPPSLDKLRAKYHEAKAEFETNLEKFNSFNALGAAAEQALVHADHAVKDAMIRLQDTVTAGGDEAPVLRELREARAAFEDAKAMVQVRRNLVAPKDPSDRDVDSALREFCLRIVEVERESIPMEMIELLNRCFASVSIGTPAGASSPSWEEWLARNIPQQKERHAEYRTDLLAKYGVEL